MNLTQEAFEIFSYGSVTRPENIWERAPYGHTAQRTHKVKESNLKGREKFGKGFEEIRPDLLHGRTRRAATTAIKHNPGRAGITPIFKGDDIIKQRNERKAKATEYQNKATERKEQKRKEIQQAANVQAVLDSIKASRAKKSK